MSLPLLYQQPTDADSWRAWTFSHAVNHYDWIGAVAVQKQKALAQYQLTPVDKVNLGMFLYNHQTMHNQVNAVLGTAGYDLLSLDLEDEEGFAMWLKLNADEHVRISAQLGVG